MDPTATLTTVQDENLPIDERLQAAFDLLAWMAKGGSISLHVEGFRPEADALDSCDQVLNLVLDRLQEVSR